MRLDRCLHCLDHKPNHGSCPHCGVDDRRLTPSANALSPGTILHGRYLVGRVLGVGGFGITYLALELDAKQKVAIKEYMPTNLASRRLHDTNVYVFSGDVLFYAHLVSQCRARLKRCYSDRWCCERATVCGDGRISECTTAA
jgi:hypothetical protein